MRRLSFVHYKNVEELMMVDEAFDRGGFFDDWPEMCVMRNGVFILEDRDRKSYVIVVCSNRNGLTLWQ